MHRLLIVPLVIALAACGGKNGGDEDATDTPTDESPDVEEEVLTDPAEDPTPDGEDDPVPDAEEDAEPDAEEDAEPDVEEDAEADAEADVDLDIDDDALSECAAALECLKGCMPDDTTCTSACMSGISGPTTGLLRSILGCAERTVRAGRCDTCASGTDTTACWTCLETACSTEIAACTGT